MRTGSTPDAKLYDLSQQHFEMADRLVLQAELDSNHKLISFILVYFFILFLSIIIFLIVNKRNQRKLETAISTDKLTGLLNRAGFEPVSYTHLSDYVPNRLEGFTDDMTEQKNEENAQEETDLTGMSLE